MRYIALLFLLIISSISLLSTSSATVYKSVDKNGNVMFSDTPLKNGQQVNLPPVTTYPSNSPKATTSPSIATATSQTTTYATSTQSQPKKTFLYTDFAMVSPTEEATIWDNQGIIPIKLTIVPKLQEGDNILIYLDDAQVAKSKEPDIQLQNIDRGQHSLRATLVNSAGDVLKETPNITLYLHKTTVSMRRPGPGQ